MTRPPRTAAVLSTVNPFPPDNGKAVVISGFLRHLVARLGPYRVHYLHVGDPIEDTLGFDGIFVHEMGRPTRDELLQSIALHAGVRGQSLQEAFTWSPTVTARIHQTLGLLRPDLELIDTIRMAQHVSDQVPALRRVLYLDDLFSVRYRRMLDVLEQGGAEADFDPIGQFVAFVPERLRFMTRNPITRRLLLRVELERIGQAERAAAIRSDVSVLLNDVEASLLRDATGARVEVVPPQLPGPMPTPAIWSGRPDFAFVGLLSIPHNHDGLSWFLEQCFPLVLALRPDARLHVIGRNPSPQLVRRMEAYGDRVVSHGFVPDLDEILGGMAGLVNTLRFGSGLKIKALEALARGLPVVATSIGAEGIVPYSQPGVTVVDDPLEIARSLVALCDPVFRSLAVKSAQNLYKTRFSDKVVTDAYDRVFGTGLTTDETLAIDELTHLQGLK